jgi:hypothetical protein
VVLKLPAGHTEKQTFESKEAICKGLQNKTLNKDCALNLRREKFNKISCVGEFEEFDDQTLKTSSGPSPVRCVGYVKGISGEKKIDNTIHWNRKKFQKVILSEFKDVKDAGEYSVNLIPHEDPTQPGVIKIFGWFIDNNKNQSIEGRLDTGVYFYHRDSHLNNRDVEISCGLLEQDLDPPSYTNNDKLEMTCFGSYGPFQGDTDMLSAHFFWDQKTKMSEPLKIQVGEKQEDSNISLSMGRNRDSGFPVLSIQSTTIDNHVELVGKIEGRMDLGVNYTSAWDNRKVSVNCMPTEVLNELMKKFAEEYNENKK